MDNSYCKGYPKMQEDVIRGKQLTEENTGSRKWKLKHRKF
jgi:hypothetical protein